MKNIIITIFLLFLCSCASRANYIGEAEWWQEGCTYEVVQGVELSPGIELLKAQVDNSNFVWTDEFVYEVLAYIDEVTHYYPGIRYKIKTPAGLSYTEMWGNCKDIASYAWCVFKYLDYPYDGRIQLVSVTPLFNHAMFIIERPSDKQWIRYQTANFFGLQKIDALFYRTQIEFDSQEYWLAGDLKRPDNMIDHWTYLVTEH